MNSNGLDPYVTEKCYTQAAQARKLHIPITTFMIASDPYLKQFVQERENNGEKSQIPWAHLDIAGTAGIWGGETNVTVSHGATGVQVRALHLLITQE